MYLKDYLLNILIETTGAVAYTVFFFVITKVFMIVGIFPETDLVITILITFLFIGIAETFGRVIGSVINQPIKMLVNKCLYYIKK